MNELLGRSWRVRVPVALGLVLLLLAAGYLVGSAISEEDRDFRISARLDPEPRDPPQIPAADVSGEELLALPRYPQSVRADYQRGRRDDLVVTRASYVARDELEAVRAFYRDVFRQQGWFVADTTYTEDNWRFLLLGDDIEAVVELSGFDEVVEIQLELIEPLAADEPVDTTPTPGA